MGCVFCASGLNGVVRNLTDRRDPRTAGAAAQPAVPTRTNRLTHIVVMGMGEPLANLDNLLDGARRSRGDKNGLGIGARHITISTVGLPAKIRQPRRTAASSITWRSRCTRPTTTCAREIVPTNDKTGIAAILEAADYFYEKTGRQVTYEYVLLGGLNDRPGARAGNWPAACAAARPTST